MNANSQGLHQGGGKKMDVAKEAAHLVDIFLRVYHLKLDLRLMDPVQRKQRQQVEDDLRTAAQKIPLVRNVLEHFCDKQFHKADASSTERLIKTLVENDIHRIRNSLKRQKSELRLIEKALVDNDEDLQCDDSKWRQRTEDLESDLQKQQREKADAIYNLGIADEDEHKKDFEDAKKSAEDRIGEIELIQKRRDRFEELANNVRKLEGEEKECRDAYSNWFSTCRLRKKRCEKCEKCRIINRYYRIGGKNIVMDCGCKRSAPPPPHLQENHWYEILLRDLEKQSDPRLENLWIAEAKAIAFLEKIRCDFVSSLDTPCNVTLNSLVQETKKSLEEFEKDVEGLGKPQNKWMQRMSKGVAVDEVKKSCEKRWEECISKLNDVVQKDREDKQKLVLIDDKPIDPMHPSQILSKLDGSWPTQVDDKFALKKLRGDLVSHFCYSDALKLADTGEQSSRLQLALLVHQYVEDNFHDKSVLTKQHESDLNVFFEQLLREVKLELKSVFTLDTARENDLILESNGKDDVPRITGLGFRLTNRQTAQKSETPLRVQMCEGLTPICLAAKELDRLIAMSETSKLIKDTLLKIWKRSEYNALTETPSVGLGSPALDEFKKRELSVLLACLRIYEEDDEKKNLIKSLRELLAERGIQSEVRYLEKASTKREKRPPIFLSSQGTAERTFIDRCRVEAAGDIVEFVTPFFKYPEELKHRLTGIIAGHSFWINTYSESYSADQVIAAMQVLVKAETRMLHADSASEKDDFQDVIQSLLRELMEFRSRVESGSVIGSINELVEKVLRCCSEKYAIELSPDENQFKQIISVRDNFDCLQGLEVDLIEDADRSSPKFMVCEFGIKGDADSAGRVRAEVPPAKELPPHLKLLTDDRLDANLELPGLQLSGQWSLRAARDKYRYKRDTESLRRIWDRLVGWCRSDSGGQEWIRNQLMLAEQDWHALFRNLIQQKNVGYGPSTIEFAKSFKSFFNLVNSCTGNEKTDTSEIRNALVKRFIRKGDNPLVSSRRVITIFQGLASRELSSGFVRLIPYLGVDLPDWDLMKGKHYSDVDKSRVSSVVFQEGTSVGELILDDLTLNDDGSVRTIIAVSAGPPIKEWTSLIKELERASGHGLDCEESIQFLKQDLPDAKIRGEANLRQAVQTFFRKLTDTLIDSNSSPEMEDSIYAKMHAYLKQEIAMELFWPERKSQFGGDWDRWIEIEEDAGGDEFVCKAPGLKDSDSNRPLVKAWGNVV